MKDIKEVIKQAETKLTEKFNYKNPHQVPKIEKNCFASRTWEKL